MADHVKARAALLGVLVLATPGVAAAQSPGTTQTVGSGVCGGPGHLFSTTEGSGSAASASTNNINPMPDPSKPILAKAAFNNDPDSAFSFNFIPDAQAQAPATTYAYVTIGYSNGFYVKSVGILPGTPLNLKVTKINVKWDDVWLVFKNSQGQEIGKKMLSTSKFTGSGNYVQIVGGKVVNKGAITIQASFTQNALNLCRNPRVRLNNMAPSMIIKINAKLPKS